MSSKSKGKFILNSANINLNSNNNNNPYTKLKEGAYKTKSTNLTSIINPIYQSQQNPSNQYVNKNTKMYSHVNINLNPTNKSNNINCNQSSIITNSNSFRQDRIITKKYKTSKNSRIYFI